MIQKKIEIRVTYLDRDKEQMQHVPDLTKLINMPIHYED